MEAISLGDVKPISLRKYQNIINHDGIDDTVYDDMPELKTMKSNCSYCEYYKEPRCFDCPLDLYHFRTDYYGGCMHPDHPFYKWYHNKTKDNAQNMYNLIERV